MTDSTCFCPQCSGTTAQVTHRGVDALPMYVNRCNALEKLTHEQAEHIERLAKAVKAAIEVCYDPGKQPAMVLTLIDLGFIKTHRDEFPKLGE